MIRAHVTRGASKSQSTANRDLKNAGRLAGSVKKENRNERQIAFTVARLCYRDDWRRSVRVIANFRSADSRGCRVRDYARSLFRNLVGVVNLNRRGDAWQELKIKLGQKRQTPKHCLTT